MAKDLSQSIKVFSRFGTFMPRLFAIGDIHGCDVALDTLLREISPKRDDVIVGIGDYVDRGPNSAGVLEILVDLVSRCRFVPLIGNHEIMMFKGMSARRDFDFWMTHGGQATLASYGGDPRAIPQHHMLFLSHCVRYHEEESYFFVHANYAPDLALDDQPDDLLFWTHIFDNVPPPHRSGKTAVVGHTPQVTGEIRNIGHILMIDTHCFGNQWLTAVDLNEKTFIRANNLRQIQTGPLPAVSE
jgi:serine/threonine protein phosphatase 1